MMVQACSPSHGWTATGYANTRCTGSVTGTVSGPSGECRRSTTGTGSYRFDCSSANLRLSSWSIAALLLVALATAAQAQGLSF
jgi:hypothetical protein